MELFPGEDDLETMRQSHEAGWRIEFDPAKHGVTFSYPYPEEPHKIDFFHEYEAVVHFLDQLPAAERRGYQDKFCFETRYETSTANTCSPEENPSRASWFTVEVQQPLPEKLPAILRNVSSFIITKSQQA